MGAFKVAAVPGAFLVDALPILKYVPSWFPGAGFQRKAREWKQLTRDMYCAPFQAAQDAIVRFSHQQRVFPLIVGPSRPMGLHPHVMSVTS